jgi:hypothetical protein
LEDVRWESSDRNVAVVQRSGELEGRSAGSARITARYGALRSQPLIVSVRASRVKETPALPRPAQPAVVTRDSAVPEAASTPRQERAEVKEPPAREVKEPPAKKAIPLPEISIREYIVSAKKYRDKGDYAAALVELEKARRIDQDNQEIQAEIRVTTRACNAERILLGSDLKC